jgi:cysteine desulfurase
VDERGCLEVERLRVELAADADQVALVTVMWANNEVGTVQPMASVAALCAEYDIPLHTDAVQAVGQLMVDPALAATLALSGHKVGGPMGVGALAIRRGVDLVLLLHGGGQERELRSGTLDTPAIVGLAAALTSVEHGWIEQAERVSALRDDLVRRVERAVPGASLNGDRHDRLPGNAHFSFAGCEGDALLLLLDAQGIECSTGSACSAGVPQPSHVLLAMGLDEATARGSLRFSLGHTSTAADVDALLEVLPAAVDRARRAGGLRASGVAV